MQPSHSIRKELSALPNQKCALLADVPHLLLSGGWSEDCLGGWLAGWLCVIANDINTYAAFVSLCLSFMCTTSHKRLPHLVLCIFLCTIVVWYYLCSQLLIQLSLCIRFTRFVLFVANIRNLLQASFISFFAIGEVIQLFSFDIHDLPFVPNQIMRSERVRERERETNYSHEEPQMPKGELASSQALGREVFM